MSGSPWKLWLGTTVVLSQRHFTIGAKNVTAACSSLVLCLRWQVLAVMIPFRPIVCCQLHFTVAQFGVSFCHDPILQLHPRFSSCFSTFSFCLYAVIKHKPLHFVFVICWCMLVGLQKQFVCVCLSCVGYWWNGSCRSDGQRLPRRLLSLWSEYWLSLICCCQVSSFVFVEFLRHIEHKQQPCLSN